MGEKRSITDIQLELKGLGYKSTPQREAILKALHLETSEHLSAEELHEHLKEINPEISLSTVYRNLQMLCSTGIAHKIEFDDGITRYELSKNVKDYSHHHHHLVCTKCGRIIEFQDDLMEKLEHEIENKTGFAVKDHRANFYGYCRECSQKP